MKAIILIREDYHINIFLNGRCNAWGLCVVLRRLGYLIMPVSPIPHLRYIGKARMQILKTGTAIQNHMIIIREIAVFLKWLEEIQEHIMTRYTYLLLIGSNVLSLSPAIQINLQEWIRKRFLQRNMAQYSSFGEIILRQVHGRMVSINWICLTHYLSIETMQPEWFLNLTTQPFKRTIHKNL